MNLKKEKLIELSNAARKTREDLIQKGIEDDDISINKILIKYFYKDDKNTDFNTYKQWKEKGFQVKRGESAFLIWGRKRKNEKKQEKEEEQEAYKFYPLAYLFSNNQVERIKSTV